MSQAHDVLLGRVARLGKLSEEDIVAFQALPIEKASLRANQNVARANDRPNSSILIIGASR
jgi:hypothetical protein